MKLLNFSIKDLKVSLYYAIGPKKRIMKQQWRNKYFYHLCLQIKIRPVIQDTRTCISLFLYKIEEIESNYIFTKTQSTKVVKYKLSKKC